MKGGVVALWSLTTHKQLSSFVIQNPSFCRLSLFPASTGIDSPMVIDNFSGVNVCDLLFIPDGSSAPFSPNCFAVADSNYGRVSHAHHLYSIARHSFEIQYFF